MGTFDYTHEGVPLIIETVNIKGSCNNEKFLGWTLKDIIDFQLYAKDGEEFKLWILFCADQFAAWSHHLDLAIDGEDPDLPDIWETKDKWGDLYINASKLVE
jgi:hypothetical protein